MLREVWRTAMLLAFASSLRVGSDGAIYLPKRLWFRGANEVAWRYDAGTLRRTETAITTVMPLVLVSFALLLLINLFAPALWILAGLALLLIAIWLALLPIRRIRGQCPMVSLEGKLPFQSNGLETLNLKRVKFVSVTAGIMAVGGLIASCAVSVYYRDFLDRNVVWTLNMLAYMFLFGGCSLVRDSMPFDPTDGGRNTTTAVPPT